MGIILVISAIILGLLQEQESPCSLFFFCSFISLPIVGLRVYAMTYPEEFSFRPPPLNP